MLINPSFLSDATIFDANGSSMVSNSLHEVRHKRFTDALYIAKLRILSATGFYVPNPSCSLNISKAAEDGGPKPKPKMSGTIEGKSYKIREMTIDDLSPVFELGEQVKSLIPLLLLHTGRWYLNLLTGGTSGFL